MRAAGVGGGDLAQKQIGSWLAARGTLVNVLLEGVRLSAEARRDMGTPPRPCVHFLGLRSVTFRNVL